MAVDILAPKDYRKAPPRVTYDQATWDFCRQEHARTLAHCLLHDRPQDWEYLKAIEDDMCSDKWKAFRASCEHCAVGDKPHVLDRNGVKTRLSKEPGEWSHSYEDSWWSCEAMKPPALAA